MAWGGYARTVGLATSRTRRVAASASIGAGACASRRHVQEQTISARGARSIARVIPAASYPREKEDEEREGDDDGDGHDRQLGGRGQGKRQAAPAIHDPRAERVGRCR